jgi:hypothetical protein
VSGGGRTRGGGGGGAVAVVGSMVIIDGVPIAQPVLIVRREVTGLLEVVRVGLVGDRRDVDEKAHDVQSLGVLPSRTGAPFNVLNISKNLKKTGVTYM